MGKSIALVDVAGYYWAKWHGSPDKPVSEAYDTTVAWVRRTAERYDHVAVALDSPPYKRLEISADYKGQRDPKPQNAIAMFDRVKETLESDGFTMLASPGAEADDMIASAVMAITRHPECAGAGVTILSADKDLCSLVGNWNNQQGSLTEVVVVSPQTGTVYDEAEVLKRFGVRPDMVSEMLAIVGDTSDNVAGVKGVGPKKAAQIFEAYTDLNAVMQAAELPPEDPFSFETKMPGQKAMHASLRAAIADGSIALAHRLTKLSYDLAVDVDAILAPRQTKPLPGSEPRQDDYAEDYEDGTYEEEEPAPPVAPAPPAPPSAPEPSRPSAPEAPAPSSPTAPPKQPYKANGKAMVPAQSEDFRYQLQPRNMSHVFTFAEWAWDSKLYQSFKNPAAIAMTVSAGRELGFTAATSLRALCDIKGHPSLHAQAMMALCIQHPDCEYFLTPELTSTSVTVAIRRRSWPAGYEERYTWTADDARRAGLNIDGVDWDDKWGKHHIGTEDAWYKFPRDMLWNRAVSLGAKHVFPEVILGLYTPDEARHIEDAEWRQET